MAGMEDGGVMSLRRDREHEIYTPGGPTIPCVTPAAGAFFRRTGTQHPRLTCPCHENPAPPPAPPPRHRLRQHQRAGLAPLQPGTYALVSIGGRALPALEPCTGVRADEARIVLDDARGVEFHFRDVRPATGEPITASATGSYTTRFDGTVDLSLSYAPNPGAGLSTRLLRTPEGLTEIAGLPCDGRDVKLYRRQP